MNSGGARFGGKIEEEDAHVTLTPVLETQKTGGPTQSSSLSSDFTSKLLNLDNPSPNNTTIASLMDTIVHHEITSATTIPLPPLFFNPLQQEATPTPTPTTSEATTSFISILDFASVFKFNERVTNLEKDLSEIKQVDQYAQARSSIPTIVDRYMENKLGESIKKAIQAHNFESREEAQAEKREYIELVDSMVRIIIKEEVNAQLPQIIPRALSDSSYEVAATLSEFELTKILIDKMEKNKSCDVADYKRELYDALVKSYNTDKDIFESYGEVFSLKKSQDDKDKDQDPFAGSDRGTKRRKSKEPSHTVEDSGMQQDQEFVTRDNDEQPADKEVTKADWRTIIAVTRLKIMKKYDYGHLEEIEVRQDDQELYMFKEGDFKRLRLQDIEDMQLLLVQQKMTNLTIDERYDLNVALRMYTRHIVIQRSNLKNKTAYTLHSNPHGIIYVDQFKRKRLMHADELHKFSDGTLNDVRTTLHDIAAGIRMEYLPMRNWSNLDKKRTRVMV
uniref:Uncharacterized protein n=1 Tax=Tanacetum cinerariifolium TaxID=118510 RepID=A0A699H6S7_TANCI|nr:hypothetical protein [Tanacetum cinerariifolium]